MIFTNKKTSMLVPVEGSDKKATPMYIDLALQALFTAPLQGGFTDREQRERLPIIAVLERLTEGEEAKLPEAAWNKLKSLINQDTIWPLMHSDITTFTDYIQANGDSADTKAE